MPTDSKRLIINCIGQAGSGKTTLAQKMDEVFGFHVYRPSSVISAYAVQHGMELQHRTDYIQCHDEMLRKDPEAMTRPIFETTQPRIWIDGLRVPAHADILKQKLGMYTLALDAPPEVRLRNIMNAANTRGRNESHINTVGSLISEESADNNSSDPHTPNVNTIMEAADYTIYIDETTSLETVHKLAVSAVEGWVHNYQSSASANCP